MTTTHESYLIAAATADERRDWIRAIRKVMHAEQGGGMYIYCYYYIHYNIVCSF